MFIKPFTVKSSTQIRSSERKKLRAEIGRAFPSLSEADLLSFVPNKEEVISTKLVTFSGESVLVYSLQKDPIFFEVRKVLYPTLYTLWRFPDLVFPFTTTPAVLKKLANGADLMLPGVILAGEFGIKSFGELEKGSMVCVNLTTNLAPIAIGRALMSSEDMYMSAKRGKGVEILHCYGDQLWTHGSKAHPPELGVPPGIKDVEEDDEETEKIEEEKETKSEENNCESETLEETEVNCVPDEDAAEGSNLQGNCHQGEGSGDCVPSLDDLSLDQKESESIEVKEVEDVDTRTPEEIMDDLLLYCFLKAWKTTCKKLELPVLTNNFYSVYMKKASPKGKTLDVKKSSYKKLSKFLKEMQDSQIIEVKELSKGVESIVVVNLLHHAIQSFRDSETPVEEEVDEGTEMETPSYCPPAVAELHTVTAAVLPIFKQTGHSKGEGLMASEVRKDLTEYVKLNQLQNPDNKSLVNLDPVLAGVVLGKGENSIMQLRWEELTTRCISKMGHAYQLTYPGSPPVMFKGKLEPVDITTATRTGNKKVTLITNLDVFGINPQEFAHKCQLGVAASTSVYPAPNRVKGLQVLVQGNQVLFVGKLLIDEYKIPKKYIKGLENAPKVKKKKK